MKKLLLALGTLAGGILFAKLGNTLVSKGSNSLNDEELLSELEEELKKLHKVQLDLAQQRKKILQKGKPGQD